MAAVLQHEHPVARVLGEPAEQHAAGRSSADDDVVEVHHHTSCSLLRPIARSQAGHQSESAASLVSLSGAPAWGNGRIAAGRRYRSHGRAGLSEPPSCEPSDIDSANQVDTGISPQTPLAQRALGRCRPFPTRIVQPVSGDIGDPRANHSVRPASVTRFGTNLQRRCAALDATVPATSYYPTPSAL
jgi:hypothetical protein